MRIRQIYNKHIKVSGTNVTIKNYLTETNMKGYSIKIRSTGSRGSKGVTKEQFDKSALRATNKIYDIVDCNVNKHLDYNGKKSTTKFLTLTFKESVTDVKTANKEFTNFNKRLSYALFKTNKNVLKYVAVLEFQSDFDFQGVKKEKGGSIHYHVIYFNLPYISFEELLAIWGKGGTYIEAIKNNSKDKQGQPIDNISKYISKYVNKTNSLDEDNFKVWSEKGMLNQKRYFSSRGLKKPQEQFVMLQEEEMTSIYDMIADRNIKNYTYENDYRGTVVISKFKLDAQCSANLLEAFKILNDSNNEELGYYKSFKEEYGQARKRNIDKINSMIAHGIFDEKKLIQDKEIKDKLGNKSKYYFKEEQLF